MDARGADAAHSGPMPKAEKNPLHVKIGAALRTARKRRGMVGRQVADALKVSIGAIGNWESGANAVSSDKFFQIAQLLRVDAAALAKGELKYLGDSASLSDAEVVSEPHRLRSNPTDVELLGVAAGGDKDRGDFRFNGEIQGYVQRPPGIKDQPRVFALNIISDSMIPRYEPGEMVYAGGRDPEVGDYVVIETFPEGDERVGKAFIKRLVKLTQTEIVTEQFNPPKEVRFDRYGIMRISRVIPMRELLGY